VKHVIAVDVGGTNIKTGILDERGRLLHTGLYPTDSSGGFIGYFKAIIGKTLDKAGELNARIDGIGVDSTGQVDYMKGIIECNRLLPEWEGVKVKELIEQEFKLAACVENDVNAAAIGEKWLGAAQPFENFVCLTVGTGLGGGAVCDDKLIRGKNGAAVEIGHTIIEYNGLKCYCGNDGCLQQYASITALTAKVKQAIREGRETAVLKLAGGDLSGINGKMVFDAAKDGDVVALNAIESLVNYLSAGIVNVLHLFNPEAVIIGGAVSAQGEYLLGPIREKVKKMALPVFSRNLIIEAAKLGNNAGITGAARLILDEL
jgi:glucokinase